MFCFVLMLLLEQSEIHNHDYHMDIKNTTKVCTLDNKPMNIYYFNMFMSALSSVRSLFLYFGLLLRPSTYCLSFLDVHASINFLSYQMDNDITDQKPVKLLNTAQ